MPATPNSIPALNEFETVLSVFLRGSDIYQQLKAQIAALAPAERFALYEKYLGIRQNFEDNEIAGEDNGIRGYLACLPQELEMQYRTAVVMTDTIRSVNAQSKTERRA